MSESQERIFEIIDLERRLHDVALARGRFAEDSPKFAELDAIHRELDEQRMKLLLDATDMELMALED
jgi:hypothetical protein